VLERWCSNGIACTAPPRARTCAAPTMRAAGQSPPFTSTSGRQAPIRPAGVSSSNHVTASTAASAATSAMRSESAFPGRPGPLPSRRAEESPFNVTSCAAPSARARAR
jgi:hypothetical protein